MTKRQTIIQCLLLALLVGATPLAGAGGKLLGTPGVAQLEGAGGGGIVPWAQLAGYATQDEILANAFASHVSVSDYRLDATGAQINFFDRLELSYVRQTFTIDANDTEITQNVAGAKLRLFGDLIYSPGPVVSFGIQHKSLRDSDIAFALGADHDSGTDSSLAIAKAHLGGLAGLNSFWNLTVRSTEANQLGILGFGCPQSSCRDTLAEFAAAVYVQPSVAVGVEYRQKPDNLALPEDDWQDLFVAWFPNKHVSVTAAYVSLGEIAGQRNQTGWYLSFKGYL